MEIVIAGLHRNLFVKGQVYRCIIRDRGDLPIHYKIYGEEFDLSCTEIEFTQHFVIINKRTGINNDISKTNNR